MSLNNCQTHETSLSRRVTPICNDLCAVVVAGGEVDLVFEEPRGAVLRCHLSLDMATVTEYAEASSST